MPVLSTREFLSLLGKESIVDVKLADNIERKMTILFSDIRSFTSISEGMSPEQNFQFINEFLSRVGPVVREHNGFIDKYIGDGIMALFDDADAASEASIDMLQQLAEYNQSRKAKDQPPIQIGIGLNTGNLMLGTIGENDRMDGTVISDAVNLASRIEGLTKLYGVSLLITEHTFRTLVKPDRFLIRLIDRVQVKGASEAVTIYEVFSGDAQEWQDKKIETKQKLEEAIGLYQLQRFAEARQSFLECLAVYPEDKVITLYIDRCNHFLQFGCSSDWDGVLHMDTK